MVRMEATRPVGWLRAAEPDRGLAPQPRLLHARQTLLVSGSVSPSLGISRQGLDRLTSITSTPLPD